MRRNRILILDSDPARVEAFQHAMASTGHEFEWVVWDDARRMIAECEHHFATACLFSLEYDLSGISRPDPDCGTGLDVTNYLSRFSRVCPVILHAANAECAWAMRNELRFAGWDAECARPAGADWIPRAWLPVARGRIAGAQADPVVFNRPPDHAQRMQRVLLSLAGLTVGDAYGTCLGRGRTGRMALKSLASGTPPPAPWRVTAHSGLALSVVENLDQCAGIDAELLARAMTAQFRRDPKRGYDRRTSRVLRRMTRGAHWSKAAGGILGGTASLGGGSAARAAPIGAYFIEPPERVIEQAAISARVMDPHPEARAGAIAVALAAAWASAGAGALNFDSGAELISFCAQHTPPGPTRDGLGRARTLSLGAPPDLAARTLGNGSQATVPDTVPFALWCAARHLDNFSAALRTTALGLGDCGTNCAIVGAIVILSADTGTVPADWLAAREPLPLWD
jgi:ADP-ribosylglycohydrolase